MPLPASDPDACAELDRRIRQGELVATRAEIDRRLAGLGAADVRRAPGLLIRRACCDLALGRLHQAHQTAVQVAMDGFAHDDADAELDAHALAALTASWQGLHDDAVVHAAQARQLAQARPADARAPVLRAQADLAQALALAWAGDLAAAEPCFDEAETVAPLRRHVRAHRGWVRLLHGAAVPDDDVWLPAPAGRPDDDAPALPPLLLAPRQHLDASIRLLGALRHDPAALPEADAAITAAQASPDGPGWLPAAACWGASAVAQRRGDAAGAARHALRMLEHAAQSEHVPLRRLAHRLAAARFAEQGRHELALAHLQAVLDLDASLAAAQRRTRQAQALDGMAWRDGYRRSAADREQFRRWAYEDALTGLGNLRAFQDRLQVWERDAGGAGSRPLCVATIDVDRFKQINDGFSHAVGDEVLVRIAAILRREVRAGDLALRWGGDEFALLFHEADLDTARQVADRVARAVREHDWTAIAPALSASVSVGVAEARPGDTKESLVSRSDAAMYDRKRARDRDALLQVASPVLLRRVDGWLRGARRVSFLVGQADPPEAGLPEAPGELLQALVALSRRVKEPLFVTERSDGLLQRAGATDVLELLGNVHRLRCTACRADRPFVHRGQCLDCGAPSTSIEPDVVALGAPLDDRVLNRAKMAMKLSDLVVVAGGPLARRDAVSLLQSAESRGAAILVLGDVGLPREQVNHLALGVDPALALRVLTTGLDAEVPPWSDAAGLSVAGADIALFLSGQGTDEQGRRLSELLRWMPGAPAPIPHAALPWMFPLTTRSRLNPAAPVPTPADFACLAGDRLVVDGLRRALDWALVLFGLARDPHGAVVRRVGAPPWSLRWVAYPSSNDLILSRILGALTLFGLRTEALALLRALEQEVVRARGADAGRPLGFWRFACGLAAETPATT